MKLIFVASVRAHPADTLKYMYTWSRLCPVYGSVGGEFAWLGREVWKVANRRGLQASKMELP